MSVRFNSSNDYLKRIGGSNFVPNELGFTMTAWIRRKIDTGTYTYPFGIENLDSNSADWVLFGHNNSNNLWEINIDIAPSSSRFTGHGAIQNGVWYFIAISNQGTNSDSFKGYLSKYMGDFEIKTLLGRSFNQIRFSIGNDSWGENLNGNMAAVKVWNNTVLNQREIELERMSYTPKRTLGLWGWYPLLDVDSAIYDLSGNNRHLVSGGTLETEDGPPISWN